MAAFREGFTLCVLPGTPPQAPLGLEPHEDRVLLTDSDRTVTLFKVSDQKPLGCWSVKQGQTITCPAVWNSDAGEFILVHDGKVLRIWKEDDTDLDKVFKATLSADVYWIHSLPHMEPLVLFKSGAVKNVDALLAAPQQEIENIISNEVIRWSDAFIEDGKHVLLFISEQDGNYFLYVQQFNPSIHQKFQLEQGVESSVPLRFTAYLKNKVFTLLCLYPSGYVCKVLVPVQECETAETKMLPKTVLLRLSIRGSILKGTSVAILDKDHIAVTGCLECSEDNVKDCFSIWNIKFQTLEASKELPQGTTGQCWAYDDKLFIIHGRELEVILYKCETSSLAAAVGKSKDTHISEMKSMCLDWNMLQEDDLIYIQPDKPTKDESKRLLRSRKSTQGGTLTDEQLLVIIKGASPNIVEEKLLAFLSNTSTQTSAFQVSIGFVVSAVVNRCKAETSFYPRRCLVQLIQTQSLSYSMCPELMAIALEKTDVHLLQLCLQQFPDIPEAVICACLRIFLSIGDDHLEATKVNLGVVPDNVHTAQNNNIDERSSIIQNGFSSEVMEDDSCNTELAQTSHAMDLSEICPVGPHKATLLNTVLCSAYSETFLLPHLKDLSAKQVTLFLQYLQYVYMQHSKYSSAQFPGIFHPTIQQIMDWLCLLLDAHFTVVVMLPEARGLLLKLHKFVRAQVHCYSELNKIEGSLKHLQKINCPKDKGIYSIEVIKLT